MIRRLQNKVAGSRMTLPLMALYATLIWVAGGLITKGLWLQFVCFAVSTVLMVELNNANALIRIYSRMVSSMFIALSCAACFLFEPIGAAVSELFVIAAYLILFHCYQDRKAAGQTFYAFMCLGISSLFCVQIIYFIPIVWILMAAFIRSISVRTLVASVIGIIMPYWLAAAIMLYTGGFDRLASHIGQLAVTDGLFDFTALQIHHWITLALIAVTAVTGMVHYKRQCLNDKIRTRMFYNCFITMDLASAAFFVLLPQNADFAMRMMIINTSPLVGHFIALTNTKITNIAFYAISAAILIITAFNLWMPSTIF